MRSIEKLHVPKTPVEVGLNLGLTSYYCIFIPADADLIRPHTQLTHKTIPFLWTTQCQIAFDLLTEALMKSTILVHQEPSRLYVLFMNGSKCTWFVVLTQVYNFH